MLVLYVEKVRKTTCKHDLSTLAALLPIRLATLLIDLRVQQDPSGCPGKINPEEMNRRKIPKLRALESIEGFLVREKIPAESSYVFTRELPVPVTEHSRSSGSHNHRRANAISYLAADLRSQVAQAKVDALSHESGFVCHSTQAVQAPDESRIDFPDLSHKSGVSRRPIRKPRNAFRIPDCLIAVEFASTIVLLSLS